MTTNKTEKFIYISLVSIWLIYILYCRFWPASLSNPELLSEEAKLAKLILICVLTCISAGLVTWRVYTVTTNRRQDVSQNYLLSKLGHFFRKINESKHWIYYRISDRSHLLQDVTRNTLYFLHRHIYLFENTLWVIRVMTAFLYLPSLITSIALCYDTFFGTKISFQLAWFLTVALLFSLVMFALQRQAELLVRYTSLFFDVETWRAIEPNEPGGELRSNIKYRVLYRGRKNIEKEYDVSEDTLRAIYDTIPILIMLNDRIFLVTERYITVYKPALFIRLCTVTLLSISFLTLTIRALTTV